MNAMRWKGLDPEPRIVAALDAAGTRNLTTTDDKRNWGGRFANACALGVADALREQSSFRGLEIRPNPDGSGTESLTGVGGHKQKKVDVIISTLASGLQVAVSLKAENFAGPDRTFGKNLMNRIYELQDEVRAIHEYQPRAYVLAVFFMPLDSCTDKAGKWSSFARTVAQLRARTGRIDHSILAQQNKIDWAVVGLYVPEDLRGGPRRGAARFFDVASAPPRFGRPRIESTLSLSQVAEHVAQQYLKEAGEIIEFSEPEAD